MDVTGAMTLPVCDGSSRRPVPSRIHHQRVPPRRIARFESFVLRVMSRNISLDTTLVKPSERQRGRQWAVRSLGGKGPARSATVLLR